MVSFTSRKLSAGESAADFHCKEGVWLQGPVWNFSRKEKSLASAEYKTIFLCCSTRCSATVRSHLFKLSSFWWRSINFRKVALLHQVEVLNIICLAQNLEMIWIGENLASVHVPNKVHFIALLDDKGRGRLQSCKFFGTKKISWNMSNIRHFTNAHLSQSFRCKTDSMPLRLFQFR